MTKPEHTAAVPLDLSVAGWCLLVAAAWELLAGRFAATVGLYQVVGATGVLAAVADSSQVATVVVAVLSLVIAATGLVHLCTDERFAALPVRVLLLFVSPFALPIIAVSIFRPVQAPFVRVGYLGVVVLVGFLMLLSALQKIGRPRRAAVLLGAVPLLQAVALFTGGFAVSAPESLLGRVAYHAAGFAQALYLATPLLLLSFLMTGGLREYVKRPNWIAATLAVFMAAFATASIVAIGDPVILGLAAFRAMGLSLNLPFAPSLYVVSAALHVLVAASLITGGRSSPADRRVGLGLLLVAMVGLHPFHPYRLSLLLAGFVYIARGLVGPALDALPTVAPPTESSDDQMS